MAFAEQAYDIKLNALRLARVEAAGNPRISIKLEAILKNGSVPNAFYQEQPVLAELVDIILEMKEIMEPAYS